MAAHKTVNPTRGLSFLGIQMDTVTYTDSLPEEKLTAYKTSLNELVGQPGCTLRELKSLIGKLQFVCTVIPSGRCFLRRFHDLSMGKTNLNSYIKFPKWVNDDLRLWKSFLEFYNGTWDPLTRTCCISQRTAPSQGSEEHLCRTSSKGASLHLGKTLTLRFRNCTLSLPWCICLVTPSPTPMLSSMYPSKDKQRIKMDKDNSRTFDMFMAM